jgi:hypothetical protein
VGFGQTTPTSNAEVESSAFNPTPVNNSASFAPQPILQPAPTQQPEAQVASDQQAQVQGGSSQTPYAEESQAHMASGAQKEQVIKQVFESSKSSKKQ